MINKNNNNINNNNNKKNNNKNNNNIDNKDNNKGNNNIINNNTDNNTIITCKFCGKSHYKKYGFLGNKQKYKYKEARSGSKSTLLKFASLSSHEVPTEQSEGEAQSQTMMCLLETLTTYARSLPKEVV